MKDTFIKTHLLIVYTEPLQHSEYYFWRNSEEKNYYGTNTISS